MRTEEWKDGRKKLVHPLRCPSHSGPPPVSTSQQVVPIKRLVCRVLYNESIFPPPDPCSWPPFCRQSWPHYIVVALSPGNLAASTGLFLPAATLASSHFCTSIHRSIASMSLVSECHKNPRNIRRNPCQPLTATCRTTRLTSLTKS